MFTLVQSRTYQSDMPLLEAAFRLRKRVFHDRLGWDVRATGDMEFDAYDDKLAQYLIWCSPDRRKLYGTIRLRPTSAPTLLYDVFGATHGHTPTLRGDTILEGTRMCIDEAAIARDFPTLDAGAGFNQLFLALCEVGLAIGATRMVSNFEPGMSRLYRRAGLDCVLHGEADGYGKRPVRCASFEVSMPVLAQMRRTIGIDLPIATLPRGFCRLPTPTASAPPALAARA
ncbi:acyl-homoserine-lactone synthase [Marivita sp. GX14005]|uniref:acyl-homoserine-lactone synthase n=1 Tax=Marivita sp. GX14005 TaxID=2942276 RepID=UPI00201927F4|nr:acyl-homoserine-lactone synthase [Marivita sp. GX14005]MCL3883027.1 GNAT family N-acetyltransferase [Marivita sp. GX14005]